MSQQERSNWRDNFFPSKWHRYPILPQWCWWQDIDAIEFRNNYVTIKAVGVFEYKIMWKFEQLMQIIKQEKTLNNQELWQLKNIKTVADALKTNAYFVGYEYGDREHEIKRICIFVVSSYKEGEEPRILGQTDFEYRVFLQRLK